MNNLGAGSPAAGSPVEFTTIPACLRAAAVDARDLEAIVDGDMRLTYGQLNAEADRFARALVAHGIEPGDRVVLWAPNSARWIVAAFGIMASGAILVPINTRFKGEEARFAIDKVRASAVVVDDEFLGNGYIGMLRDGSPDTPTQKVPVPGCVSIRTVVTVGDLVDDPVAIGFADWMASADGVDPGVIDQRIAAQQPDDVVDVLFTSGTTGYPKGAMVTHRSNLEVDRSWGDMTGLVRGDRYLLINPFFHSFGYRAGILACLIRRAVMVPMATFDVERTMRIIESERITVFPGAPTVYSSILEHPNFSDYDFSSVRLAVTGATIVPVPLLHRMRGDLGFEHVVTAYGLTECCGTATVCPPDTDLERISTSCGVAVPGVELRIVADDGTVQPPGSIGEVQVRGYNVMVGYFEDPEATAAAIDIDGWLHTGDAGRLDEDGYLRITDRIKDVFMVGGFNVYPAEVERMILEHPAVSDVAVVAMDDARLGEVAAAYVQLAPGKNATTDDLAAFCHAKMANYKRPRQIHIVDSLPRTASGKIQKFKLGSGS